ncbi:MAG: GHKL domain-containing protein [Acetatifactor sp.]|nr:GHKL domain-containing protein [Acetatifactor sp.]
MFGSIVYNCVELLNYYLVCKFLLGVSFCKERWKYVLLLCVSSIMQVVAYIGGAEIYRSTFIPLLTGIIGIIFLAERKRWRNVFIVFLAYFISSIVNVLGGTLLALVLQTTQNQVVDSVWLSNLAECTGIIVFLAYSHFEKETYQGKLPMTTAQYVVLFLGAVCLYILVGFAQMVMRKKMELLSQMDKMVEWTIMLFAILFAALYLWQRITWKNALHYKIQNERYSLFLSEQEKYIHTVIMEDERRRKLRHDMNAHMLALQSMASEQKWDELCMYLKRIGAELNETQTQNYTGISSVDAIINTWKTRAEEQKIGWEWHGMGLRQTKIDLFDLCVVFSNILSNAVEASSKVKNRGFIKTQVTYAHGKLVLNMENACDTNLSVKDRPTTSKEDAFFHGLGLKNVENIVKKYQGFIGYEAQNGVFSVNIIL